MYVLYFGSFFIPLSLSHASSQDLAQRAKITHTKFVRTTSDSHYRGVKILWVSQSL